MAIISFISSYALLLLILLFTIQISAQTQPNMGANFSCSKNSPSLCESHVAYFAQPPKFMNLQNISNLFRVSPQSIAKASNLVFEKQSQSMIPNQLLLVPINCGCTKNHYFANITYQIKEGDSYYLVSITSFENLTNWQTVKDMNPTLNPILLKIGVNVTFPLFCRCPSKSHLENGIKHLITYVWQPSDDIFQVSANFNSSPVDIITQNNIKNFTALVGSPILIPVSKLPSFSLPHTSLPVKNRTNHRRFFISIMSSACIFVVFLLILIHFYARGLRRKRKTLNCKPSSSLMSTDLIQIKEVKKDKNLEFKTMRDKLLPGVSGYLGKPIIYEARIIREATMNFDERFRIGGSVYKPMINGQVLAVKKKSNKKVREELNILQKVNHANLVNLLGISSDNEGNHFMVYEYAQNGSLDKWLQPNSEISLSSMPFLSWNQRLHIALDVANGLEYLHEHTQSSIVHRDIRTNNILLDSKFKAKIANFSMAKAAANAVMTKVDVFAFGVVLLELLSGKKALKVKENGEDVMLWKEAKTYLEVEKGREKRLREWMDPNLQSFYPIDGVLSFIALAMACTKENPSERPSMAEIVFNLSVLAQSSPQVTEGSWSSNVEGEEDFQILIPISAR